MKNLLLTAVLLAGSILFAFSQDVWVQPYVTKNGTYVQGHFRSQPDGNSYNNYSFPGNTNPYTGKTATGNVDTYLKDYNMNSYSIPSNYSTPTISVPSIDYSVPGIPSVPTIDSYLGDLFK